MTTARDVMSTKFHTFLPNIHIAEAVKMFKKASEIEHQKVFLWTQNNTLALLICLVEKKYT